MDIDTLVMTAAAHHGVYATGAETFAGPVDGAQFSIISLADNADAARFANACMADLVPARAYGATVVVLHT